MSDAQLSRGQIERLLEVGRTLVSELDLEVLLSQVIEAARDLTGARYAALGVLDSDKQGLERFVYLGIDEETRRRIGPLPQGRGVLGELISHPEPLRLDEVSAHPRSYGFPAGHPDMRTFLGVPITVRGEAWGNLYLTEKAGGQPFEEVDERLVTVLAEWAAVAVENARLHGGLERRQAELERAVRGLETSAALARAGAAGMEADRLGRLIAKRGRDLVRARRFLLLLPEGEGLSVAAAAGEGAPLELEGTRISPEEPMLAEALRNPTPRGFAVGERAELSLGGLGVGAKAALLAPLDFRSGERGLLVALDPLAGARFETDDERLFESFAASAVTTLSTARAAEAEKLRLALDASEQERRRWARELHDETLQELGALQVIVEAMGDAGVPARAGELLQRAADHIDRGVKNLEGLITELRPATLDELGVGPAVGTLVDRVGEISGLAIEAELELEHERREPAERLAAELESAIYRLVQEGLNNVVKHASAAAVYLRIVEEDGVVEVTVRDDGDGFDPASAGGGFGLVGMRERVALVGGSLAIDSEPGRGTELRAELPSRLGRQASGPPPPAGGQSSER
ncbi:MAG: GAF domain-containing protein [Solirubrobacterales bacterium]|nr:GAF domain-containing protein [Solirubrobacterales bacterium]